MIAAERNIPKYRILRSPDDALILDKPGTIRWATQRPDGRRSLTWQVFGSRNSDDLYVYARGMMGEQKLSLHQSGVWRFAFTKPFATKNLPPEQDSLIQRYHETVPFTEGWRQGAVIRTPTHTLGGPFDEPPTSDGRPILLVPTPEPPKHLQYIVLLGDADTATTTLNDVFDVGRMTLRSGKRVWIVAQAWEMNDSTLAAIAKLRATAAKIPGGRVGIASGDADGVPLFLDVRGLDPNKPDA
jgi:hypothetical protein